MAWKAEWEDGAIRDLRALDTAARRRVHDFVRDRLTLAENPRSLGHALSGRLGDLWSYRVGNYRILCRIEDARLVVLVVQVGHRREVYR